MTTSALIEFVFSLWGRCASIGPYGSPVNNNLPLYLLRSTVQAVKPFPRLPKAVDTKYRISSMA